jgi:hypothetical protein
MSKFLTELDCSLKDNSDNIWVLDKKLVYYSDLLKAIITAPEVFNTDFASVPRVPVIYEMFGDTAHRESVIHDLLFCKNSSDFVVFDDGLKHDISFMQANGVFYEAMVCRGKSYIVRHGMYYGVVAGGYTSFHKRNVMDRLEGK